MGYSITWFAIREERAPWLQDQLGLLATGEREAFPESLISTARLDTGWRVFWYNRYDCPFLAPSTLEVVTRGQVLIVCHVEEHVMASSAEQWCDGSRAWWIAHDGEAGPKGLLTDGTLPDCFAVIDAEMQTAQANAGGERADVDYLFEIPLKVAQILVGFKHDEDCPQLDEGQFVVLERVAR